MKDKYQIPFTNACIRAFASRLGMTTLSAFHYLREYKGMKFLIDFYHVVHLQSIDDTVDDLILICAKNGGTLR